MATGTGTLTPPAFLYCTESDVQYWLSADGEDASLDDNNSVVDPTGQGWLAQAIAYATSRVNMYCQPLYDVQDLSTSYLVNYWTSILAACQLRQRRGNPLPDSLRELLQGDDGKGGVMGDLAAVRKQQQQIPDIGYRNVSWPAWSNVRVDPRYRLRQIRVERPISERTPTQYPQNVDWQAELTFEI